MIEFTPGMKYPSVIEQDVKLLAQLLGVDCKFWVAGGRAISYHFNRVEKNQDIDLFFSCEEDYAKVKAKLDAYALQKDFVESSQELQLHNTENALTYSFREKGISGNSNIQLIKKFYGTTDGLFNAFHMGHCEVAYGFDNSPYVGPVKSYYPEKAYSKNFVKSWGTGKIIVKKMTKHSMLMISKAVAMGLILDFSTIQEITKFLENGNKFVNADNYDAL
jgi:hypothetical protein